MPKQIDELSNFFSQQQEFRYKKGETVIRLGDTPSGVYFIEKGYIKVYSLTESGEENLHFIYKSGEIFPLTWVFNNKEVQGSYEAMTPTDLRRVSKEVFFDFLKSNNEVMFMLMQYAIEKIDFFFERVNNLELTNSYPRIISRLLFLARRLGREDNGKIVFDLPITQRDIAVSINMTRETASKELNKLAKKKIIDCKGRSVLVINDIQKLEEELLLYYERKSL